MNSKPMIGILGMILDLLHPKSSQDLPSSRWSCYGLWDFGEFHHSVHSVHSILFVIVFTLFTHPSSNSVPPHVSCFRSTSHFQSLCSIFRTLNPDPDIYAQSSLPWYALFWYIYVLNFMYVFSLKSTLIVPQTPHPNLWTLVWHLRTVGIEWCST